MRCGLYLLLLVVLPGLAQEGAPAGGDTFKVDVDLVVLHATVRDRQGKFVPGLKKEDFHVFEDGRPQAVRLFRHEDMPVSVGLVVDNSLSMSGKRGDVTAAALAFSRSSNPLDQMFIVNFNQRVSFGLPPSEAFTASASELEKALNGFPAYGMTALYDAIEDGLAHLKMATAEKKVLIVVSDGGDNASRHTLSQVLGDAERSDAIIYTIGIFDEFDGDQNPGVLRRIARATGGETFLPSASADVTPICERIAADIRHQYTIGYAPSNQKFDGSYRTVKVTAAKAHQGKVFVRTRAGYIASEKRIDQPASPAGRAQ
jgi:Ca-activated chloride channel homolog